MKAQKNEKFGLIKTLIDAHTMGVYAAAALLKDCGYTVIMSTAREERALESLESEESKKIIVEWIKENEIKHIGISYRLDPNDAVNIVGRFVTLLKDQRCYECLEAVVKSIYFAGLKPACEMIEKEYNGRISTFKGGESAEETLAVMGVPEEEMPENIVSGCKYDREILKFGKSIITDGAYKNEKPLDKKKYSDYGKTTDSLIKRLDNGFNCGFAPLIRAHSGPYSPDMTREDCLKQYLEWCRILANSGYLDILSIGSSQLSQSNFGENWNGKINGGGVPVNSEKEYIDIWNAAKPMLVRTYSATKNVRNMAEMYERTIHIAWHALSLWWFDELDGRGVNNLYQNLNEHIDTMKYVAFNNTPVETNVSHHFAFRGCDDVTYILAEVLAAKMAKKCGVKYFILQNMLNTPRSTWGIQDLAKSRVVLKLIKELEDSNFRVIFQTRAGLDYFKPDIEEAKIQLAAVTAMMDDIDPYNICNPEIIHVVSYSEALYLATPDIINDSIKITRKALHEYRNKKKELDIITEAEDKIAVRMMQLENDTRKLLKVMENSIPNLYSAKGLYIAFVAGWLPVPQLWLDSNEFKMAKQWQIQMSNGGLAIEKDGLIMSVDSRINKCIENIKKAEYIFKSKYGDKRL